MAVNYPVTAFHFQVEWGGSRVGFTEVSGLDHQIEPIDYREGSYKEYQVTKMPGIPKFSNVNLKRGVLKGDNEFEQWLTSVKLNDVDRRDITISLLNEDHEPVVVYNLKNSWITSYKGISMNSTSNEVAVEEIEICHEGLTVEVLS
jgi:phage tail-like protein